MQRSNTQIRTASLVACTAMAAALLTGCATHGAVADAGPAAQTPALAIDADAAISSAEARVAKSPRNGAARAALAQAYLTRGRFASAATTFEDAVSLGQSSPKIGLSLALAYAGAGNNDAALQTLDRWREQIPASDYGLALALAGQPEQGVAVLTDLIRGGQSTPKARQNLAYAYALGGHWGEARVIAMQDVPADQLDARLSDWASRAAPEQGQLRVAALLGTVPRLDPGQPTALALNGTAHVPSAAPVKQLAGVEPAARGPELPAVHTGESFWGASQPDDQPQSRPQPAVRAAQAEPASIHTATYQAPRPVPVASSRQVSRAFAASFVAPAKVPPAKVPSTKVPSAKVSSARAVVASTAATKPGTHLAQLGAFSSRDAAERAKAQFLVRNPSLKGHGFRVTEADVAGKHYFRLAAEGFDRDSAQSLCGSVKRQGGACLAMADTRPQPGVRAAAPSRDAARKPGGAMLAQR